MIGKKGMNHSDPYLLDSTDFARFVRADQESLSSEDDDIPAEPPHPLLENPHVRGMCEYLESRRSNLRQLRKPNGGMSDDPYFEFNEGLMVRPEVIAMFCLEYCRAHPEILT